MLGCVLCFAGYGPGGCLGLGGAMARLVWFLVGGLRSALHCSDTAELLRYLMEFAFRFEVLMTLQQYQHVFFFLSLLIAEIVSDMSGPAYLPS